MQVAREVGALLVLQPGELILQSAVATLHGGESLAVVGERFWEALSHALDDHAGPLVLVSHGYAIQALLRRLDPNVAVPRFIGNGDVVEICLEDGALAEPPVHTPLKA